MNYQVYDFSDDSRKSLENFEKEIKEKLITLLPRETAWKCSMKMSLVERVSQQNIGEIKSNANFGFENSYDFISKVRPFFHRQVEYIKSSLKPHHAIVLELTFRELTEEEKKKVEEKNKSISQTSTKEADETNFIPINPLYDFSKVILSEKIKEEILSAINILKYQDLIYNRWGFKEVDPVAKSVLNFYGPPGTGKTMSAHAVAHELRKPLLALNYAEIESKYVGEAPKNLMRAFTAARDNDAVLFFDEADSFLGKRIQNVTQGAEQALNSLRSQMLMLLEQHPGVIIFATNMVSNFDSAFESRILKHIKFELPNKKARIEIIKKMLPSKLPWNKIPTSEEIEEIAEIADGFSGREMKSAVLETLLYKVSNFGENTEFIAQDFKNRFEHKKEEKKRLKEEADAVLKQKITNALNRQATAAPPDAPSPEKDKKPSENIGN